MNRRAQKVKTEIRQEQIAEAALELIARRGLDELNIGALARQVGVVPSAIHELLFGGVWAEPEFTWDRLPNMPKQ